MAGDAFAVEPRHSPDKEVHDRGLLLIRQHLDIGQPCGVIIGHMGVLVVGTR